MIALGACSCSAMAQYDREHLDRVLQPLVIAPSAKPVAEADAKTTTTAPLTETQTVKEEARLTAEGVLSAIHKQIVEHYDFVDDLNLTLARQWRAVALPGADFTLEIIEYPEGPLKSQFSVKCKVSSEGRVIGEWPIALKAQLWREVWIATDRINRGTQIDRQLLTTRRVDVLREGEGLIASNVDLSVFEVGESIAAGRGITKRDVVERPLIRKNQIVEVSAQRGALSITMKAQALESGGANALIRVRNIDSRKEFNAQVIDAHRVQVVF